MTPRQLQTLKFIEGFWDEQQYGPSWKDIRTHLQVASDESVRGLLSRLKENGWVTWVHRHHRSVRSLRNPAGGGEGNGLGTEAEVRNPHAS